MPQQSLLLCLSDYCVVPSGRNYNTYIANYQISQLPIATTFSYFNTFIWSRRSGSCYGNTSSHIGIYYGYNKDILNRKICGFQSTPYKLTLQNHRQYVYVTFHTNEQANTRRIRGFSRVEYTLKGMLIITLYEQMIIQMNILDINECRYGYRCDHGCVNLIGSYNCTCRSGYYLSGIRRCLGNQ